MVGLIDCLLQKNIGIVEHSRLSTQGKCSASCKVVERISGLHFIRLNAKCQLLELFIYRLKKENARALFCFPALEKKNSCVMPEQKYILYLTKFKSDCMMFTKAITALKTEFLSKAWIK